jgi:hypothetical protein
MGNAGNDAATCRLCRPDAHPIAQPRPRTASASTSVAPRSSHTPRRSGRPSAPSSWSCNDGGDSRCASTTSRSTWRRILSGSSLLARLRPVSGEVVRGGAPPPPSSGLR